MSQRLLDEFAPISKQQWLDKLVSDLKGKPYERLVRLSESGIPIAPVYTADDLPAGVERSYPGMDDLRRGDMPLMGVGRGRWRICQAYAATDVAALKELLQPVDREWISAARIALADAERMALTDGSATNEATHGLAIQDWSDLQPLVDQANANEVRLWLDAGDATLDLLDAAILGQMQGGLDFNPFRFFKAGQADEGLMQAILGKAAHALAKIPAKADFKMFTISLVELESAGANAAQQLAFAIAMATDLAARLETQGVSAADAFRRTSFLFPISTDFFGEIAKLRAFRILWGRVLAVWGLNPQDAGFHHLQATPAHSQETVADPHVNLLRHTTQAMAAVLGGCDMLTIPAYNAHFDQPDADGYRIARNIHAILGQESHLGDVIDPVGGAYFAEQLTDALAEKAWPIFQAIEAAGGWYVHLGQGKLAPMLAEGLQKRQNAIRSGAKSILGTNIYPNEKEILPATHSPEASKSSAIAQRLQALGESLGIANPAYHDRRLAADFEGLRRQMQGLHQSNAGCNRALLLTMGDPLMRSARATFSRNVFAAGGFVCTENAHPSDLNAAIAFAQNLQPSAVVLCGADADYLGGGGEWVAAMHSALPNAILILAGKPEGWEALKESGIQEAIYAGMDRVAFLSRILNQLQTKKEAQA